VPNRDQWAFCLDALAATHRVIALDLLGFGRSDKPPIDYRIAGFVEVLDRFLSSLGITRASLLGHSLGGWVVATFALSFPDRVDNLILNNAAGIDEGARSAPRRSQYIDARELAQRVRCHVFTRRTT
jgi:pimeloyl-ACP methyl ester carboxylesterase